MEANVVLPKVLGHEEWQNHIVVDCCPYCGRQHVHSHPLGDGQRLADCFIGEYVIVLNPDEVSKPNTNL